MNWEENWDSVDGGYKEGGQGKVVKLRHKTDKSILGALKIMHHEQEKNSSRRARLITEIKLLEIIDGNGVPKVLEYFEGDDNKPPYFIAEWKEGFTLDQFVLKNTISIAEALNIVKVLASTIKFCHDKGIVHRDIKPQNIIIQESSNTPILVDFGISWVDTGAEIKTGKTPIGEELGNRFLRLPELSAGSESKHEQICDVSFLVGILFYIITKKPPRQLRDSKNLMPHERLSKTEKFFFGKDHFWARACRVFNVGFNQNEELRFESIDAFIKYLDETFEIKAFEEMDLKEKLDERKRALAELLGNEKNEAKRKSIEEFKSVNEIFSQNFQKEIKGSGFSAGLNSNNSINSNKVNLFLKNDAIERNQIIVSHEICFSEEDSKLIASFEIQSNTYDGSRMVKRIIEKEDYYRGYTTDLETLREKVTQKSSDIILRALNEYQKLV